MPSNVTELALRAAVNSGSRSLTSEGGQTEAIKEVALKRAHDQVSASGDVSSVPTQLSLQTSAIEVAVAGIALAYTAISGQLEVLDNQRLSFDKERQSGIATFMLPTNKEESDLSAEEKVIKGFLELVNKNPSFAMYLGIHTADLLSERGAKFHSILPFYRMSEALEQPVASMRPLDRARVAINLFFKSALPDVIADIEVGFQTDWKIVAFCESSFQRKNYLNNRRASRFIIMALSNLLWNLQHPVNQETGFPMSLNRCIALCRDVEQFLNKLLNPETQPFIQSINNSENELMSFIRKLEIYTKTLRFAFIEKQLHELNIEEITNSAHQALRIMDKGVFKLIYKRYNPLLKKMEPDENAAEALAHTVGFLNILLAHNPLLIDGFQEFCEVIPSSACLNRPLTTIIDVLIIFCHLPWRERDSFLAKLEKGGEDSAMLFAEALRGFDRRFIKPIKAVSKAELQATYLKPKYREVGSLTASRLVPLITLVVEDYRIEVDSLTTYEKAKGSQSSSPSPRSMTDAIPILSGIQQVQAINLIAQTQVGYYRWALSPFVEGLKKLDQLPIQQYRLTQISKLMDSISELVTNYRSFLLHKSFQTFLLKCLKKVKKEYAILERNIAEADLTLDQSERVSRNLRDILGPMVTDLNRSLDEFSVATTNFEQIVRAPDFIDKEQQLLTLKIGTIAEQFSSLFTEDSGLIALLAETAESQAMTAPPATLIEHFSSPLLRKTTAPFPTVLTSHCPKATESVEREKVCALRGLVCRCLDALSYQSKQGRKGLILRKLLSRIDEQVDFTDAQIKHAVMELTRVSASYRETWFFQAAYGHTRSGQALISAIKDKALNRVLPLADIIFDHPGLDLSRVKDDVIMQRIQGLQNGNKWAESSTHMWLNWPDSSSKSRGSTSTASMTGDPLTLVS